MAAAAIATFVVGGDDDEPTQQEQALCDLLAAPVPGAEQMQGIDLVVFIEPQVSDRRAVELREQAEEHPDVERVVWVDQDQAYEEFAELHAGNDELLESVTAEILPPSLRLVVREDAELPVDEFEDEEGVFRVVVTAERHPFGTRMLENVTQPFLADDGPVAQFAGTARTLRLSELVAAAPEELRADLVLLDEAMGSVAFGEEPPAGTTEAAQRLVDFAASTCGLD